MRKTDLDIVRADLAARRACAVLTWLGSGEQRIVRRADLAGLDWARESELAGALEDAFRTDKSRLIPLGSDDVFINVFNPALRLIVIGAVHISQALAPMALRANYDVIVVDPRTAFATPQRFTGVRLDPRWPDEAVAEHGLDARTALIALTHDARIDDPALHLALHSDAFYVGALGSRRTHEKRVARLREAGLDEAAIARIHAPIGLDIGAIGAAEIAISILAQMTAVLRERGSARTAA